MDCMDKVGVCAPWITEDDVRLCCTGLLEDFDLEMSIAFATNVLYRLSGHQFPGVCERTVRPFSGANCGCDLGETSWYSYGYHGWSWPWRFPAFPGVAAAGLPSAFGACCRKHDVKWVNLPGPVDSIVEVVVDGEVLDESAYISGRRLLRADGGSWPCSNDFSKDSSQDSDDAEGTWQVTYNFGKNPGLDGKMAAAILACETAKAQCGSEMCVLPRNVRELVRGDVTFDMFDPLEFLKDGKIGIYEVDAWLHSVNPSGIRRRGRIRRMDRSEHKKWG